MDNTITKIETQKKKKDRVNVYIDGEYSFSCNAELIYIHALKKGKIVNMDYLKDIIEEDNYLYAKSRALSFIERTFKTENEIRVKLKEKEFNDTVIDRVIEFLRKYNFVDDTKYAELYIKERIGKQGKLKIKYSLVKKGIDDSIIDEKLSKYESKDEKYINAMREAALKKYTSIAKKETDKFKIKRKLSSYLMGRGYSWSEIGDILKEIFMENY
ncbi:recombination regulator RecX [Clostridium felsineum]|uniref:Regulatory protein RecX n=1 Tax=Clostridium felsineum TaxID=36839 RepID=A0A1S8LBS4_9CLOT|nr:recombination regulator RecX [Clostridium felsineum]MCR3761231.1 recombination regulator RecX [Clostridium felsineum]URZ00054.1 Regulatory protein RecX [Clostridium felsineum]URZ07301.1 Regulatory protein RecX [Clostridium felsineum]URZ12332.1 Regulatory protein RecX [Clostridium felsineum]